MACCLTAPSHYLNQCWLPICVVLWHSSESNFTMRAQTTILYNEFDNLIRLLKLQTQLLGANELMTWFSLQIKMLPTPAKFHYIFNLRDLSRIWQGMINTLAEVVTDETIVMGLWKHECCRVIADRWVGLAIFKFTFIETVEKYDNEKKIYSINWILSLNNSCLVSYLTWIIDYFVDSEFISLNQLTSNAVILVCFYYDIPTSNQGWISTTLWLWKRLLNVITYSIVIMNRSTVLSCMIE